VLILQFYNFLTITILAQYKLQIIKNFLKLPKILYFFCFLLIISVFFTYFTTPAFEITGIDFLGQATLPKGLSFQKTPVGGLSGITYDAEKQVYYAISDDRSERSPARFYTFKIDLSKGSLKNSDVTLVGVTKLRNESDHAFDIGAIDAEGIALASWKTLFISSEVDPFIQEFLLSSGRKQTALPMPRKFLPKQNHQHGIRNNLAFESLTITPDKKHLFTATENALIQDGLEAKPNLGSHCRIVQYNLLTKKPEKEFLYPTEPVAPFLNLFHMFTSGLSDLLALDNQGHFLSVERSFTGLGFSIALFQVSLEGGDNIFHINSLLATNVKKIRPVQKKLLLDLSSLHILLDNIEGLTLGPILPDGHHSLILISDNNFNLIQRTQILAFRLKIKTLPIGLFPRFMPNFNR